MTEPKSEWQKPSIYSVAVVLAVLALIGYLTAIGKLSMTQSIASALVGAVLWITNGARPPVLDQLPTPGKPKTVPPGPPPVAVLLLVPLALVAHLTACVPSPQAKAAAAETSYTAELVKCVDDAKANAEVDECQREVRAKWHVSDAVSK